jgi:hypothetical protein
MNVKIIIKSLKTTIMTNNMIHHPLRDSPPLHPKKISHNNNIVFKSLTRQKIINNLKLFQIIILINLIIIQIL